MSDERKRFGTPEPQEQLVKTFTEHDREILENSGRVIVILLSVSLKDIRDSGRVKVQADNTPPDLLEDKPIFTEVAIDPNHFYRSFKGELLTGEIEDFYKPGDWHTVDSSTYLDPLIEDADRRGADVFEEGLERYQKKYIEPLHLENAEARLGHVAQHAQLALEFLEKGVDLYGEYYAYTSTGESRRKHCIGYYAESKKLIVDPFGEVTPQYVLLAPLITPK